MALTFRNVGDKVLHAQSKPGRAYVILLGVCVLLVIGAIATWYFQVQTGIGITIMNNPVGWGIYITTFVFWVGIAHSGTAISAILFLVRARWRTSIFRTAEAMTLFAVATAGMFPIIHIGRLWRFYYLFPYPNQRDLWPNFKSPLAWDMVAITTYATVSACFLYIGMIPDLAIIRDRSTGWKKRFYGTLSLGWRGSDREWKNYLKGYILFAGLATPLVISVHSVVSWDFAVSVIPGWHTTIFAPYFVAGAIHSGFAMVLTLLIPLRKLFKVEDLIGQPQIDGMCKVIILTGLIVGYAYGIEFFIAWYSGNHTELDVFIFRATGEFAIPFWIMVICNVGVPIFFFWKKYRQNLVVVFILSLFINVGMWFERFNIIVTSLAHDWMPHNWGTIELQWPDMVMLVGSFGWFFMWLLIFLRAMPWIAIAEVRELLPVPKKKGKKAAPKSDDDLAGEGA